MQISLDTWQGGMQKFPLPGMSKIKGYNCNIRSQPFNLEIRNNLITQSWNLLLKKAVKVQSLSIFESNIIRLLNIK